MLLVAPVVLVVGLVAVQVRRARRHGTVDERGRLVVGPAPDSVESAIRQRAGSDGFTWLICVMVLDSVASVFRRRQLT